MKQNPSLRVGVVADDLTSATDGAAPFLSKGYAPLILRNAVGLTERVIVSIETNSRASTVSQAVRATTAAISALADRDLLFKTMDSTLRGHVREEIIAALRASGRSRLVLAPAFPAAGRLTIGGIQSVNGIPVSDSDYGLDPVHPARTSRVAELIDPLLGRPVILAQDDAREAVQQAATAPILILDADNQDALNRQVARIPDPQKVLWVGSPGLAIALASLVPAAPDRRRQANETGAGVLIVAGSANPVTHIQCDVLLAHGISVVNELASARAGGSVLCLRTQTQRQADASAVLTTLADQCAAALARHDFDGLVATGGETTAAILDRLDIHRFLLTRELEPGFPVGRAERPDGTPIVIAMKAGGFGSPLTLLHAARDLFAAPARKTESDGTL